MENKALNAWLREADHRDSSRFEHFIRDAERDPDGLRGEYVIINWPTPKQRYSKKEFEEMLSW